MLINFCSRSTPTEFHPRKRYSDMRQETTLLTNMQLITPYLTLFLATVASSLPTTALQQHNPSHPTRPIRIMKNLYAGLLPRSL
ncbi:hypothetical protein XPA_004441 [Xanthoria parietina]